MPRAGAWTGTGGSFIFGIDQKIVGQGRLTIVRRQLVHQDATHCYGQDGRAVKDSPVL